MGHLVLGNCQFLYEMERQARSEPLSCKKNMMSIDEKRSSSLKSNSYFVTEEDEVKESVDEYGKDERLDLEDNDPEYEPEEYDDKEMEQDDVHDMAVEGEEEHEEEHLVEEEEGDMMEDELEDVHEELEGEEDEDHPDDGPEHPETLDVEEDDHHEVFKERRKRKEFEVFVGGLDKDATEDDLRKVFSAVGEVTEVRLMMNPQTRKNKGFAFLRFATVEQARRAVTDLRNPVVTFGSCSF